MDPGQPVYPQGVVTRPDGFYASIPADAAPSAPPPPPPAPGAVPAAAARPPQLGEILADPRARLGLEYGSRFVLQGEAIVRSRLSRYLPIDEGPHAA
jgi:hypothetical protein